MDLQKRGLTVFFFDGGKVQIEFPPQTDNDFAAVMMLKEVLKQRQFIIEIDGAILVIPFDNIKYFQAYPAPSELPPGTIRGASVRE